MFSSASIGKETDVMISPSRQKIIQIDITNACMNSCSNCSRFCGHHKKPFFMDFLTFKKACESLYEFKGMVGIMGGEPTLHPEFERFVEYYDNVFPRRTPDAVTNYPIDVDEFIKVRNAKWSQVDGMKRGLWTALGLGYGRHYEIIRRVFEYQCVNDHKNPGMHQALLITRKELGIPDEKFFELRDKCWVQNLWSAAITPKGAFFCEFAAAFDMLLDGPGGWPLTRDWWKREPKDFEDQLHWCEMCSACLAVPEIKSNDDTDIVSPEWKNRLEAIGSKKKTIVFDVSNYDESKYKINKDYTPYLPKDSESKLASKDTVSCLAVGKLNVVIVSVGYGDILEKTLPYNVREADSIVVVTTIEDTKTIDVCEKNKVHIVISEKMHLNGAVFNKGAMVNDGIGETRGDLSGRWILLTDADCILENGTGYYIRQRILNPGFLYYAKRFDIDGEKLDPEKPLLNFLPKITAHDPGGNDYPYGYFQLFRTDSSAFKKRSEGEGWYSEEYYSAGHVDNEFHKLWPKEKWYRLPFSVGHVFHGRLSGNWHGREIVRRDGDKC